MEFAEAFLFVLCIAPSFSRGQRFFGPQAADCKNCQGTAIQRSVVADLGRAPTRSFYWGVRPPIAFIDFAVHYKKTVRMLVALASKRSMCVSMGHGVRGGLL